MNRRRHDFQSIDTSVWPTVDSNALAAAKRKTFEARYEAINLYAAGQTLREIETRTGISSRQLDPLGFPGHFEDKILVC